MKPTWNLNNNNGILYFFNLFQFLVLNSYKIKKHFFFFFFNLNNLNNKKSNKFFFFNFEDSLSLINLKKNKNLLVQKNINLIKTNKNHNNLLLYLQKLNGKPFIQQKIYYLFIDFLFLNSFNDSVSLFKTTGFYKFFFFKNSKGSTYYLNINKILSRFVEFSNFLINIYFFNLNILFFSSPLFKTETLSLNWNTNNFLEFDLWKSIYFYFVFKTNKISTKINLFFKKLYERFKSIYVVLDCDYHYKNLYFFKKNWFYTIGFISLKLNPWLVTYPIFASSNFFLNQLFFIKFFLFSQKKSLFFLFLFLKKIWKNLELMKNFN